MAYEKVKLVLAFMSGELYMANIKKDGTMSESRRVITDEVLAAATEWFMANKRKMVRFGAKDDLKKPHLFFTDDHKKADRILEILNEEEVEE